MTTCGCSSVGQCTCQPGQCQCAKCGGGVEKNKQAAGSCCTDSQGGSKCNCTSEKDCKCGSNCACASCGKKGAAL
ncbi:hypothetical protein JCM8547_004609 [Rhodosporidiobolus lusitaniae]